MSSSSTGSLGVIKAAFFAPAKTPRTIVQRLYDQFRAALAARDVQSRFTGIGAETVGMPPDEFARVFDGDLHRWTKFVRETGLKLA